MTVAASSPEEYHRSPGLSSTIAKILLEKTPKHAWTAHPTLNPDWEPKDTAAFDIGRVAHAVLLGKGGRIGVVMADSWATKAAKAERESAVAAGKTAVLEKDYRRCLAMADSARDYLARASIEIDPARSEMMASAEIDGVLCRMMADNVPSWPTAPILDLKTTESVSTRAVQNAITGYSYDVQAEWYRQVWHAATGELRDLVFLFVEKSPPHACRLVQLLRKPGDDADWSEDAAEKCAEARRIWRLCTETGEWPDYPAKLLLLGAPHWHRAKWADAQTVAPEKPSRETLARAADWQAPPAGAE